MYGALHLNAADEGAQADPALAQITSAERTWALLQRLLSTIIEPEVAAERILTALEANRLYALTHGDPDDDARNRAEGILAAVADTAPVRGGPE